ncbi:MAG: fatty acyl-AMP ligase, partial [Planctomycetota bacterium]
MFILKAFEATPQDCGCNWLPTYHDMGLVGGVLVNAVLGTKHIFLSPVTFLQRPIRWLRTISDHQIAVSGGPNFAYQLCLDKITDAEMQGLDLSHWRVAFNGAEPIRAATLEAFTRRFSKCGFRREAFLPCYGMAETTLLVTGGPSERRPVYQSFDAGMLNEGTVRPVQRGAASARVLVGCGAVLPNEEVLVVDPETCRVLPDDKIGELWVSNPCVGHGYWNNAQASESTFGGMTADGRGPFCRTGDLGFLYDDQLYVSGRLKDLIIIRGVNRYPQDIEETVEASSDAVQAGAVAAMVMQHDEEERLVIVAETVRGRGIRYDDHMLRIRRAVNAQHELPPDAVVLVRNSSVPKTSSGKIQRHACLEELQAGTLKVVARWARWEENANPNRRDGGPTMMSAAAAGSAGHASADPHQNAATDAADSNNLPDDDTGVDYQSLDPVLLKMVIEQVRGAMPTDDTPLDARTNVVLDLGLDSLQRLQIAR